MGQINTNNYPTVNSLLDADLLIVENATNGTGTTTPKQLRENAIGTDTLQTSSQTVTGAINELKGEIDAGAGVVCYDVDTITSGYLGGQFSGSANLLLLHLTTDGTADATNGYMMMLSYSRPVARFAIGRLVDADGVAYKQDVYADNTIICTISGSGEGTESDPVQVVILGIINAGFMLTPTAVVSDRDIQDGQGNTLSVLAEALTKTASGNPVVIDDCAGGKARSLKTTINAFQNLHGYDHPWAGGADKNKFALDLAYIKSKNTAGTWNGNVYTVNGGTITIVTDNDGNVTAIKVNGTFNGTYNFVLSDYDIPLNEGTYIFTCDKNNDNPTGLDSSSVLFISNINGDSRWRNSSAVVSDRTFTITDTSKLIRAGLYVWANIALDYTFYPMIRLSSEQTGFAPWENKCPISGRTAVAVDDTGVNLFGIDTSRIGKDYDDGNIPERFFQTFALPKGTYIWKMNGSASGMAEVSCGVADAPIPFANINTHTNREALTAQSPTRVITITDEYPYAFIGVRKSSGTLTLAEIEAVKLQLEVGETAHDYEPYAHSSATIQLGTTVYGAEINWDTGVMTVKTACPDLGGLTWTADATGVANKNRFYADLSPLAVVADSVNLTSISSQYTLLAPGGTYSANADGYTITAASKIYIYDEAQSSATAADFKTAMSGVQTEYTLDTPTTIQLTPEQLTMLKGVNRVTIDNGSIELGYIAKIS